MRTKWKRGCEQGLRALCVLLGLFTGGCASHKPNVAPPQRPNVAPAVLRSEADALQLDASHIEPMYTQVLAVDLPSVVKAATADNLAIQQARQAVEASQGRYESTVGSAFPALVPTALFHHVEGTVRATEGNLVGVGFNTFQLSVAVQWVINPGRVIYEIIAAKKRLAATEEREQTVILETLRRAALQYYDLVHAQASVSAAHQSVTEAEELLRTTTLRARTGVGVPADVLRAEAGLAQRRQDLILAMKGFYDASVALAVTLHLDSSVTLVPNIDELPSIHLVRVDLTIEELLGIAVLFRPDLQQVRTLLEAAAADKGSTWWGSFGPQFALGYEYGGITAHTNNIVPDKTTQRIEERTGRKVRLGDGLDDQTFAFGDRQRANAGVGWRLSASAFGDLKTAGAVHEHVRLEAERQLDQVRAQVVSASQASRANHDLVGLAGQQVTAAAEALRLSEANLKAGAMTTLDVLQAQDAVAQARLSHAEAVVRYNQSQVNLLAALGLLDEASLSPPVDEG